MLRVRVLGPLALERDGEPLEPPSSLRARLLLGWLAVHPGLHARAELAARLRPDVLDESARQSLRQALWALRAPLGEAALVAGRDRVGLAGDVWVDLREFGRLAAKGDAEAALALVRGDLLAGLGDDWVLSERDAQRSREDELRAGLSAAAAAAGDHDRALAIARSRAEAEPLSEAAARDLMQRLADAGDRAAALTAYERHRARLGSELGVAPGAATRELAAALRGPGESGERTLPPRLADSASQPFVGRTRELGAALARWREAGAGHTRLLLVAGEPGMGKTRLAAEVAARAAADGATVLLGRCDEEPLGPYSPWAQALAPVVTEHPHLAAPELARLVPALRREEADAGDPAGARMRLFDGVVGLLGKIAPAAVVLDDLHWADAGSLRLLVHLARAAPAAPLLVVATYRHTEMRPELTAALTGLHGEPAVERLHLRGLGDAEVGELVAALAGDVPGRALMEIVSERTGGSPFFIGELVRAGLPDAVPTSVREVIERRLDRLGEGVREALVLAAVIGERFELVTLANASGSGADELGDGLDRAVAAGLVREPGEPGEYAFAHALVREALDASLGATKRARTHAAIGRALAAQPDPDPAAVAFHFCAAAAVGHARAAVDWSRRAAAVARAMLGYESAAAHLGRAVDAAGAAGLGPRERCELLLEHGDALARAGAAQRAHAAFDAAATIARSEGDAELLARAAVGCGGLGVALVEVDRALIAQLEEALSALGDADDGERAALRARLLGRLAIELYYTGEEGRERGRRLTADAVALARRSGDSGALARALAARHVALWRPDCLEERLAVAGQLVSLGGEAEIEGRHWRFVDLMEAGDASAARAELDAYERLAAELRVPAWEWYVPLWRSMLAMIEGRLDAAERLRDEALELGRRAEDPNAALFHVIQSAAMAFEHRDFDELELTDEVLARAASDEASMAWRSGLAWIFAATGDSSSARSILHSAARDGFAPVPWDANRLASLSEFAECALLLGDLDAAGTLERLIEPFADQQLMNGRACASGGSARYVLGRLAAARGDRGAATAHLERALAAATAFGAVRQTADAREALDALKAESVPGVPPPAL